MLFVCGAAARSSDASPPFHRNWDNSETTQQKHYVGATSCHVISVHVINSPMVVHQTLATTASSSTATPSTSASTTPSLKGFKFLSEKVQQSGSADDRSQSSSSSTCATMHAQIDQYLHELRSSLPEDVITFRRRRQAAYPLLVPLAQDLVAPPVTQAYVERVFSECGWLTVGRRNRLSKNLEIRVFLKMNKDLVWMWLCDWAKRNLIDAVV